MAEYCTPESLSNNRLSLIDHCALRQQQKVDQFIIIASPLIPEQFSIPMVPQCSYRRHRRTPLIRNLSTVMAIGLVLLMRLCDEVYCLLIISPTGPNMRRLGNSMFFRPSADQCKQRLGLTALSLSTNSTFSSFTISSRQDPPVVDNNSNLSVKKKTKVPSTSTPTTKTKTSKTPLYSKCLAEAFFNHDLLTAKEELELSDDITRAHNLADHINELTDSFEDDYSLRDEGSDDENELSFEDDFFSISRVPLLTSADIRALRVSNHDEIYDILEAGSRSRQRLISCNYKLVVSIAKKWMRNNMFSQSRSQGKAAQPTSNMPHMYTETWDLPSLDEAIQEGTVGLIKAADRFDPSRKLRFSTYATFWITSHVRDIFRAAKTQCFKVPPLLHSLRIKYLQEMKNIEECGGRKLNDEEIAEKLGVSLKKLNQALLLAEPLRSIDTPVSEFSSTSTPVGGETSNQLFSETLISEDTTMEEMVDRSYLRQSLENAMASELSPHERDVLRLRLGLDDGISRTVREVSRIFGGTLTLGDVRLAEKRAYRKLRRPEGVHHVNLLQLYVEACGGSMLSSESPFSMSSTTGMSENAGVSYEYNDIDSFA